MIDPKADAKKSPKQLVDESKQEWREANRFASEAKQARKLHDLDSAETYQETADKLREESKHDYDLAQQKYKGK